MEGIPHYLSEENLSCPAGGHRHEHYVGNTSLPGSISLKPWDNFPWCNPSTGPGADAILYFNLASGFFLTKIPGAG